MAVGPDGGGSQNQEVQPNGAEHYVNGAGTELDSLQPQGSHPELSQGFSVNPEEEEEAELSVAVGMAEGQMENILQEATKEEVATDTLKEESGTHARVTSDSVDEEVETEVKKDAEAVETTHCAQVNGTEIQGEAVPNDSQAENGLTAPDDLESDHISGQKVEELNHLVGELPQSSGDLVKNNYSDEEQFAQALNKADSCASEPSPHRTITNGFAENSAKETVGYKETCLVSESDRVLSEQQLNKRASLLESSTETLIGEVSSKSQESAPAPSAYLNHRPCLDGNTQTLSSPLEKPAETGDLGFMRTLNGGSKRPSVSALQSVSADLSREGWCNGEGSEGELGGGPQWAKGNAKRVPLSRQVSVASCNSLILHPRGSCSQHRWCHSMSRSAISPEQPSRSHLDDDGLALHTDVIQQRLRQIEAGHQMEVETLKKQMQELWSCLKNQQHASSPRINGDLGDELVRRTCRLSQAVCVCGGSE